MYALLLVFLVTVNELNGNLFLTTFSYFNYKFFSIPHLRTVSQLLANMESCQLSSLSQAHLPEKV